MLKNKNIIKHSIMSVFIQWEFKDMVIYENYQSKKTSSIF